MATTQQDMQSAEAVMFKKVLAWQSDLLPRNNAVFAHDDVRENVELNKEYQEHEAVKELSTLLVILACFQALRKELSSVTTEAVSTRKGMVAFLSIEPEYLNGLHLFLQCWQDEKYRDRLTTDNNYYELFKDVKSLLLEPEKYNPVFVRNNCTEANKIYVTAFPTADNARIDTTREIPKINTEDVAVCLPQLLSWHNEKNENDENETFLAVMADSFFPSQADRIKELYNQRFAKSDLGNTDFSQFIELVMRTIPAQIQSNLSELALYHACVLYFFERPKRAEDLYQALKQAMGNALVAFHMNREPTAFDDCWGDNPNRKSSKKTKGKQSSRGKDKDSNDNVAHYCQDTWEKLAARQNWASNLNATPEANSSKENGSELRKIESLRLQFNKTLTHLNQENKGANEEAVDAIGTTGTIESVGTVCDENEDTEQEQLKNALIAALISAYDNREQQRHEDKTDSDAFAQAQAFDQAVNRFYAVDWRDVNALVNFADDIKQRQKSENNKNLSANLTKVLEEITTRDQYPEDSDEPLLVEQVRKICKRVLGDENGDDDDDNAAANGKTDDKSNSKKLTPDERTNLLSFIKRYPEQIGNGDLSKFLKKQVQQLKDGTYDDLAEALASIILSVQSELKEESTIRGKGEDKESVLDSIYLEEATLHIEVPSIKSFECLEKAQMLSLSFFSMMYGPLLQELSELEVGEKPLFKVLLEEKDSSKASKARSGAKSKTANTDESAGKLKDSQDLINFVDWCASLNQLNQGKCSWWSKEASSTKSETFTLNCTVDLVFITTKQGQTEHSNRSRTFVWEFNKQGIGYGLFLDVSQLLGIKDVTDFESRSAQPKQKQNSVLRHAYFNYNFHGIKGEYLSLSLDNTETFETLLTAEDDSNSSASSFITFSKPQVKQVDPKDPASSVAHATHAANAAQDEGHDAYDNANANACTDITQDALDYDLMAFFEQSYHDPDIANNPQLEKALKLIEATLDHFVSSYSTALWEFLRGRLRWQQVKACAQDYELLLKLCSDGYCDFYESKKESLPNNVFTKILFRLLRIGIADEADKSLFQFKPIAIACPWHIEGLKTIALNNKRVVDFVRSIRAYAPNESEESEEVAASALAVEQEQPRDDRINLAFCNDKLFGQEGLIKLLQSPLSLELVLPSNADYTDHAFLYRTQHCQGYALYEQSKLFTQSQNEQSHEDLQSNPILAEEMKVIREQFIRLIANFESNNNELNILFWQCPNNNLPLELFCSCLQPDSDNKSNTLAGLLASYHHVSFYVACQENEERKLRLLYESRLRSFWAKNQDEDRQHIINNKFSIIVTSSNFLKKRNVGGYGQEQFFDLCLCYDIFSANARDYNDQSKLSLNMYRQDDFLVSDERFFPAFYAYQSPKAQEQYQCFLIAPFYTNTIKQMLRAFHVLIHQSAENLAVPYIANRPNKDKSLGAQLQGLHNCSSFVVTCDRLLTRKSLFSNEDDIPNHNKDSLKDNKDNKVRVFHFKQEGSIARNIGISAKNVKVYEQVIGKLKYLLENDIGVTADDNLERMQKSIYNSAIELSGSIMLKAHQHSHICNEMVGLVLTQFIMEQIRHNLSSLDKEQGTMGCITLMLDDYVRFLGLNDNSVADILTVEIFDQGNDRPYKIRCFVAESKFYQSLQSSTEKKSREQLSSTVSSLAQNFSRQHENFGDIQGDLQQAPQQDSQQDLQPENEAPKGVYYDRVVFRQRLAELFFEKIYNFNKDGFGQSIQKLVKGNFEAEIYAVSCCFGYAPVQKNANVNAISFKCFEGDAQTQRASIGELATVHGGVPIRQAQLRVEGKDNVKELLRLLNNKNSQSNQAYAKEFFKSLRSLLVSEDNATPVTAEAVDRAFHDFGLAPLASSANFKHKP